MNKRYYPSLNTLRLVCLVLMILSSIGLPFKAYSQVSPILNFATGTLFAIYGFLIYLKHDENQNVDYKKYIRRLAILFIAMCGVYFATIFVSQQLLGGSIKALFTKRKLFEFVVLNVWFTDVGSPIWLVQATLYAMIVLAILDKLKLLKYDSIICIVLFIFAFLISEGAGFIKFSFLGYGCIPGNFLTRALPYMLLGKIICERRNRFRAVSPWAWLLIFVVSGALCYGELFLFSYLKKLVYMNHLVGFIPMTIAAVAFAVRHRAKQIYTKKNAIHRTAGYAMYAVFSLLSYIIVLVAVLKKNAILYNFSGLFTLILSIAVGFAFAYIIIAIKNEMYDAENKEDEEEYDEDDDEEYEDEEDDDDEIKPEYIEVTKNETEI